MNHRLGHEYLTLPALFEQKFTKVFPEQIDCNLQFYRVMSQSLTICRLKHVRTLLSSIWLIMISLGHHREETVMNNFVRQLLNIRKPNSIHPMFTIFHTATLHAYILSLVHFPWRIPTKWCPCWRRVCMTSPIFHNCLLSNPSPVWQLLLPPLDRWSQFAATLRMNR